MHYDDVVIVYLDTNGFYMVICFGANVMAVVMKSSVIERECSLAVILLY